MGKLGWRAGHLGLFVFVSGLACGTSHVAGPAIARTPETDRAVAAARAWLEVLATKDAEKLIQITQLPFTFAGEDHMKRCDAEIGDTGRLERLIGCIAAHAPTLVTELGHATREWKLGPTDRTQLRTSVGKRLGPVRSGEHLVFAVIGDETHHFELVLLLVPEERGPRILVAALALHEVMIEE